MTAPDPWADLRHRTDARIALGRAGDGLPTARVLEFQYAHARARDAVHRPLDEALLRARLPDPNAAVTVRSAAPDRAAYLKRPDLGRRLAPESEAVLDRASGEGPFDAVFVLADGLSALALHENGPALLAATMERLPGWTFAPPVIAHQARVALGDAVAPRLKARMAVMLIGERPGLSAADSLGVYLTWDARPGRRNAERNCISNIRAGGLGADQAADLLAWLMAEARRLGLTGVALKADRPPLLENG